MLILTIKTDNPEAEVGLFEASQQVAYKKWPAHRQLAETLHTTIAGLLKDQQKDWQDIEGLVCFEGPGSFTGLRIGISLANALAWSNAIPIVGSSGKDWIEAGIDKLATGQNDKTVLPEYGSLPHITVQKK